MNDITVGLGERSYAVRIEAGLLARAGAAIAEVARNRRIAVVGDENVSAHVDTLLASWQSSILAGVRTMQQQRLFRPELDARTVAEAFIAGIQGGVQMLLTTGSTRHLESAVDTLLAGVRTA